MDKIKILLIDDEVDFVNTLVKRLFKRGLDTNSAESGESALALLKEKDIDVVVLDVRMPGMDGIQTLREIKKTWPLTEVIMLTGHASVEFAIEGMKLGAFDYMLKPIDIDDLVYKLQDAHKKKQIQEDKILRIKEKGVRVREGNIA